jgi:DNA-3-methyladenine glycosylase
MFPDFLDSDADTVARGLLGCLLVRDIDGMRVTTRIVETEAYDQLDPASHTFRGRSERNRAMFGPAGHAYIYLIYGMYYCMNVTAFENGFGAGVLIRAVEPVSAVGVVDHTDVGVVVKSDSYGSVKGAKATNGTSPRVRMEDVDESSNVGAFVACRRPGKRVRDCFNGPAKLCRTLGIDMDFYGHDLREPPLRLESAPLRPGECVEATERIGITKAKDRMRRFVIVGNPYLSR